MQSSKPTPSMRMMKLFLQNHEIDIEDKSEEEILKLYKDCNIQEVMEFQKDVFDNGYLDKAKEVPEMLEVANMIKESIKRVGDNVSRLYGVMDQYMEKYPYEELKFLILSGVKKIPLVVVDLVTKIKAYQYQEIWLEKIADNLDVLPAEEKSVLMDRYQNLRDNLAALFKVYQKSFREEEVLKMQKIAQSKLELLKNFSPQLLETNYSAYYNEGKEKLDLIHEILSYTQIYSRSFLKNRTMKQLMEFKEEILKHKAEKTQSKKLVFEHIQALEESMTETDDSTFDAACMSAINELNNIELQKVIQYLGSKNRFFINRFEEVAKRFRDRAGDKIF